MTTAEVRRLTSGQRLYRQVNTGEIDVVEVLSRPAPNGLVTVRAAWADGRPVRAWPPETFWLCGRTPAEARRLRAASGLDTINEVSQ